MNACSLQIDQLSLGYRTQSGQVLPVVRAVSLTLGAGETLGLVGESGCGKSTLGMALLGHLRSGNALLGGRVLVGGADVFQLERGALARLRGQQVAFVPQNASQALTPTMRLGAQATEALTLHLGMDLVAAQRQVLDLFERLRLPQAAALLRRYPHELSGGQQQRVVLAMALVRRPAWLILDEPTTGLDVITQAHVLQLLQTITREQGTGMLYISHDLEVVAQVSARVAVMYAGELVEIAPVDMLFADPNHPYTSGLLAALPHVSGQGLPASIPGQPPALHEIPPTCAFAPRCSFVTRQCHEHAPTLGPSAGPLGLAEPLLPGTVPAASIHLVRCHHAQHVATVRSSARANGAVPPALPPSSQTATHEPLLVLHEVRVSYARPSLIERVRRIPAAPATVDNLSLVVHRGETLALVGESGSGKTTLLRAIAGLKAVEAGRMSFGATDLMRSVDQRPHEVRRAIQIVFQNPDASLNPRQTIAQILAQPLRLYFGLTSARCRERAGALLERVRLAPYYLERFPGQLSGGEKQRVAIARAFAAEPELVLCDEVISALDVSVQSAVLELLNALQAEQRVAYLFITHNLAVVRAIADRVAVLYHGRLCEVGPVAGLAEPPWHPYTATLLGATGVLAAATRPMLARDRADPAPPARGCPFQRRCPHHLGPICDEESPPWQELVTGRRICCHLKL